MRCVVVKIVLWDRDRPAISVYVYACVVGGKEAGEMRESMMH